MGKVSTSTLSPKTIAHYVAARQVGLHPVSVVGFQGPRPDRIWSFVGVLNGQFSNEGVFVCVSVHALQHNCTLLPKTMCTILHSLRLFAKITWPECLCMGTFLNPPFSLRPPFPAYRSVTSCLAALLWPWPCAWAITWCLSSCSWQHSTRATSSRSTGISSHVVALMVQQDIQQALQQSLAPRTGFLTTNTNTQTHTIHIQRFHPALWALHLFPLLLLATLCPLCIPPQRPGTAVPLPAPHISPKGSSVPSSRCRLVRAPPAALALLALVQR